MAAAVQRHRLLSLMDMLIRWPLLSPYASKLTSIMLFFTMFQQLFPRPLQYYVTIVVRFFFKKPKSSKLTLVFKEKDGMSPNQMFDAAEAFLSTKNNPDSNRLRVTKQVKEDHVNVKFANSEVILDSFEGISLAWNYVIVPLPPNEKGSQERKYIVLRFEKMYKDTIINSYLPWIIKKSKELDDQKKLVKLHNLQLLGFERTSKESVNLDHPSTFDTLAMAPKMKKEIIDDLDLFLRRREFYRKVGKAWKRGYLLYGPPGTGKSSLIAAIANYLKFDIYDLQLNTIPNDSCLKKLMLNTSNRSIIVIEDIDCSKHSHDRTKTTPSKHPEDLNPKFTLSGLLNFIDGLWSCCGDERIIIFTTNHKEKLDPALLRPGRMDVHIHMSYLTTDGFKILAANYLNIHDHHWRFTEIEDLINATKVTPAEVAEELMKSDDQEVVLEGLVNFLKCKKRQEDKTMKATHDGGKKVPEKTTEDKTMEATHDGGKKVPEKTTEDKTMEATHDGGKKVPRKTTGDKTMESTHDGEKKVFEAENVEKKEKDIS